MEIHLSAWPIHLLILGLFVSVITDLNKGIIYNVVSYAIWVAGTTYNLLYCGYQELLSGEISALVVFIIGLVIYRYRLMGAGDIKLIISVSVFFGLSHLLTLLFFIFLTGGIIGVFKCLRNHNTFQHTKIAFAVPIAIGTLLNLFFLSK